MIYLDYAANNKVFPEVVEVFSDSSLEDYANPNANHLMGKLVMNKIAIATERIKKQLKVMDHEIIYTSGATESNNLAIRGLIEQGFKGKIITTPLEHSSVVSVCNYLMDKSIEVEVLTLNEDGKVNIDELKGYLKKSDCLVSINYVDSELGIIQPIDEISSLVDKYPNSYLHVDASQALGKIPVKLNKIDLVTISPHKCGGINGIGLLLKKKDVKLYPQVLGGKSLTNYRSGTPTTSLILSLPLTFELALDNLEQKRKYVENLYYKCVECFEKYDDIIINSDGINPYILNISVIGIDSKKLQEELSDNDVYVSTKSACSSDNNISSSVYSLTNDLERAKSTIRISFSYNTTLKEIIEFLDIFSTCYNKLKK